MAAIMCGRLTEREVTGRDGEPGVCRLSVSTLLPENVFISVCACTHVHTYMCARVCTTPGWKWFQVSQSARSETLAEPAVKAQTSLCPHSPCKPSGAHRGRGWQVKRVPTGMNQHEASRSCQHSLRVAWKVPTHPADHRRSGHALLSGPL